MNERDNGGPAFPRPASEYTESGTLADGNLAVRAQPGMSLRDYFAAKAMQAEMISSMSDATPQSASAFAAECARTGRSAEQHLAVNAYKIADAMLAERKK